MRCTACNADNPTDAAFCEDCGARLELACPHCGAVVSPGKKFCRHCGESLDPAPVASKPAGEMRRIQTPAHLAERILMSKASMEGERKQVTVLFADLKGSMELLADRDPEEARGLLEPVLERMIATVHRYEGTVNQVMGDGIMALFGAPLAHEDHAARACYAALTMHAAVRGYSEDLYRSKGVPPLQIRIGLNSGEVVVGAIGSDLRMEYTAVGQTTHLAARMEQLASPGSSLLTGATLQLAEGYVTVKPHGQVPVKGMSDAPEVFELTGVGAARSRFQVAATRGLTKFVGRLDELERLNQALEKAQAGRGQVAALVGEPGVGKSRIIWEFTRSHRTQGWLVLESGSVSYGKATAYRPVIDLLRSYFRIEDSDDARRMRERVTGKLVTLDEMLRPTITPLLALLDIPFEDAEWARLDPLQRRQRMLDACKRLLLREAQVQPLILVFEDLHWIDSETQSLLDGLVDSLTTAPVLLLVNYRPEYEHHWGARSYYVQLRIAPLPPESADALIEPLLGNDPGLAPLKKLLIERTEGNPLFLEESVRTLAETGAIRGERGAYRLTAAVTSIQVPVTVQAILAARIDRLPGEEKQLIQSASVIGKDVPFVLLQAIAGLPEDALERGLTHLQTAEFLYEAALFPDREYTFKHALTHDVAYSSVLQERRKALHSRIVTVIEELYRDRLVEHVERLATHAVRGGVWDKAVGYLRQAGSKASARSANREAAGWFEQAMKALEHLPQTRQTVEQKIDISFDLRNSLYPLAEFGHINALLREAESASKQLGDQARLTRVYSYLTHHLWATGEHERAIETAERSLAKAAGPDGPTPEILASHWTLGQAYHAVGRYRDAVDYFQRLLDAVEAGQTGSRFGSHGLPAIFSRSWLTRALAELGRFDEGLEVGTEGLRLAEALGHPFSLYVASWGAGYLQVRAGRAADAVPYFERAVELCKDINIVVGYPTSAALLGYAYALSGRIADGLALLEEAVRQAETMRVLFSHSIELAWLGEAYLLAGRIDDARDTASRALQLAVERKERGYEAWILFLQGSIAAHVDTGAARNAANYYQRALHLATDLQMHPLLARCCLSLAC